MLSPTLESPLVLVHHLTLNSQYFHLCQEGMPGIDETYNEKSQIKTRDRLNKMVNFWSLERNAETKMKVIKCLRLLNGLSSYCKAWVQLPQIQPIITILITNTSTVK